MVAIKKFERVFEHKVFARRTLRELKIMRLLQHENVLSANTIVKPNSLEDFDDLYVVMELMDTVDLVLQRITVFTNISLPFTP